MGLANDGILEGCEYLNLKFSIHLGDFCIEEVFWLGQGFPTNMFVGLLRTVLCEANICPGPCACHVTNPSKITQPFLSLPASPSLSLSTTVCRCRQFLAATPSMSLTQLSHSLSDYSYTLTKMEKKKRKEEIFSDLKKFMTQCACTILRSDY